MSASNCIAHALPRQCHGYPSGTQPIHQLATAGSELLAQRQVVQQQGNGLAQRLDVDLPGSAQLQMHTGPGQGLGIGHLVVGDAHAQAGHP